MTITRTGLASLVVLAVALVFGVVLGLVLAFGSEDKDAPEERWAELEVPELEVPERELHAAQVIFAEHFGAVTSDFRVYVSTDLEGLNEWSYVNPRRLGRPTASDSGVVAGARPGHHAGTRYRVLLRGEGTARHEGDRLLSRPITSTGWTCCWGSSTRWAPSSDRHPKTKCQVTHPEAPSPRVFTMSEFHRGKVRSDR